MTYENFSQFEALLDPEVAPHLEQILAERAAAAVGDNPMAARAFFDSFREQMVAMLPRVF